MRSKLQFVITGSAVACFQEHEWMDLSSDWRIMYAEGHVDCPIMLSDIQVHDLVVKYSKYSASWEDRSQLQVWAIIWSRMQPGQFAHIRIADEL